MSPNPEIGELRHRVTFKTPATREDGFGGRESDDRTTVATVWARVVTDNGSAKFKNERLGSTAQVCITYRGRADIDEKIKTGISAYLGTREFKVEWVLPGKDNRAIFVDVYCSEETKA